MPVLPTLLIRLTRLGRPVRAVAAALLAAAALAVLTAAPASAHAAGGDGASNFHTVLTGVGPDAPAGLSVRVVEDGNRLELENRTGRVVYVLGYAEEPYLRITSTGVDENLRSTATYLNVDRFTSVAVPDGIDNTVEEWKHVSDRPVARWHDHRIHWMTTTLPPAVAAAPDRAQQVYPWKVLLTVDGRELTVSGSLEWVPGPSSLPWWALVAGLAAVVLLGCRVTRFGLPVALTVLTAADVAHTVGVAADQAGRTLADAVLAYPLVDVGWLVAVVGVALLVRGTRAGLVVAAGWGAWATLTGGLAQEAVLHHSSAPFVGGMTWVRLLTAVELGVGAAVTLVAARRLAAARQGDVAQAGAGDPEGGRQAGSGSAGIEGGDGGGPGINPQAAAAASP